MNIQLYLKNQSSRIETELLAHLPKKAGHSAVLNEAVRYAVLSGGKRIRPILVLASCEAVGGTQRKAMPAALAIEFIHNYSLTHDDLPCMDDDDWRRGKPTCHKKFGEVTALLAGDALLTLAFRVLSDVKGLHERTTSGTRRRVYGRGPVEDIFRRLEASHLIAEAAGLGGMVGGQAVDMEFQKKEADLPTMEYINAHKTGALIAASTRVGALLGGGTKVQVEALYRYGKHLGLLFQIVDDILDTEGYAKLFGVSGARNEARSVHARALKELKPFGIKGRSLARITDFVLERDH